MRDMVQAAVYKINPPVGEEELQCDHNMEQDVTRGSPSKVYTSTELQIILIFHIHSSLLQGEAEVTTLEIFYIDLDAAEIPWCSMLAV